MAAGNMDNRRNRILDIIICSYVETAEPVGSRTISKHSDLGLSPASIRNVMADLEEQGYLKQPHTSAGRIPSDKGYRYWVDSLMRPEELLETEKDWIEKEIEKAKNIAGLVEKASKLISQLTENAAVIYVRNLKRVSFLNQVLDELIEAHRLGDFLEEETELFVDGIFRVFEQPEFQEVRMIRNLLQAFEEKYDLLQILLGDLQVQGVHVHIGSENVIGELENVSMVVKDYYVGQTPIGSVGVVGPTRMKYPKVVSVVDFVADSVTERINRY